MHHNIEVRAGFSQNWTEDFVFKWFFVLVLETANINHWHLFVFRKLRVRKPTMASSTDCNCSTPMVSIKIAALKSLSACALFWQIVSVAITSWRNSFFPSAPPITQTQRQCGIVRETKICRNGAAYSCINSQLNWAAYLFSCVRSFSHHPRRFPQVPVLIFLFVFGWWQRAALHITHKSPSFT